MTVTVFVIEIPLQIDERCREVLIKYETGNMVVSDLDIYYKALDTVCGVCMYSMCIVSVFCVCMYICVCMNVYHVCACVCKRAILSYHAN